jgi:hypothetical protein
MAEEVQSGGEAQSFKKAWAFASGSISAQLQSAAAQIVLDSRLPCSNVAGLLNGFFERYLGWPFRATHGRAYDSSGAESPEFGSLIYTSSQDLARVPADALACAIETHHMLGLEELRASYDKIAKVKAMAKTPVPRTSSQTPIADATMGIIFAADSNVPLERLAEELGELNKGRSHNHWVDMVVILARGTINYGCQFPHKPLGDFLPPAREGIMRAPMYVHIVAKAHAPFCLNRMCALLFYYLYLFAPGTPLPPYKEILEGVPTTAMTIAPYQQNLSGQLVPVPLELQFNRFFLFPIGFSAVDGKGEELARVRYLPWQDGGVVRVTGKLPIEGILVFGGKEAISQPVIKLDGEQFSGVIPMSGQQFIDMAERMARQSHNIYIKPDPRPNWVVENRGNEGTSSPFIARMFLGICRLRDQALLDAKKRETFDIPFEALLTGLENIRIAAAEVVKLFKDHEQQVARGEKARIVDGIIQIESPIDRELRKCTDEVIGTAGRVMKDRMQAVLRAASLDIGFLYRQQSTFLNGIEHLRQKNPDLAAYLVQTRSKWFERVTNCRIALEHNTWMLPKVRYDAVGNSLRVIEPQVDGQLVTDFVTHVADRICCFAEDLIAHALQAQMPQSISVTEIPLADRKPEIVERFRPALLGGGTPIWKISYHESKFEAH